MHWHTRCTEQESRMRTLQNRLEQNSLRAAGEFPCKFQAALTPRDFVAIYTASFKIPEVEGDPGYVEVEIDAWADLSP